MAMDPIPLLPQPCPLKFLPVQTKNQVKRGENFRTSQKFKPHNRYCWTSSKTDIPEILPAVEEAIG